MADVWKVDTDDGDDDDGVDGGGLLNGRKGNNLSSNAGNLETLNWQRCQMVSKFTSDQHN